MSVCTFIIDYIVTDTGDQVPVYCREDELYLKLDDVPEEYYDGLKKFLTKEPGNSLKPEWEKGAICMEPYEFLFLVGGTYRGSLNKYMSRLSDLIYSLGQKH